MTTIEAPFEMSNLFPKHTGLPFTVWISVKGGARHDVRVKVSRTPKATPQNMISVAIGRACASSPANWTPKSWPCCPPGSS